MRADAQHLRRLPLPRRPDVFEILFRQRREQQIVAQSPRRIAVALLLAQHAKRNPEVTQHLDQRQHRLAPRRIVGPHAAQPQAIFLRSVVNRNCVLFDKLLPLARSHAQRIPVPLHRQEQLCPVGILPRPRIHGAPPQPDDRRQMLNPHRTLEFARAARGALEHRLVGNVGTQQRCFRRGPFARSDKPAAPESLLSDSKPCPCWTPDNALCSGHTPRRKTPAALRASSRPCR